MLAVGSGVVKGAFLLVDGLTFPPVHYYVRGAPVLVPTCHEHGQGWVLRLISQREGSKESARHVHMVQ